MDPIQVTTLLAVVGLLIKEAFNALSHRGKNGPAYSAKLDHLADKINILLSKDVAGTKTAEWWDLRFQELFRKALEDHEARFRRPTLDDASAERAEIKALLKKLDADLCHALAEIVRQIKQRNTES